MTRVFYASTLFGAMSLAAAIDAGRFGERSERRLLIVSTNTAAPEVSVSFDRGAGFEPLRQRFDDIVHWNELIAPLHPGKWIPPAGEVPLLGRLLADRLRLGDDVSELVLESVAVAPARTIGMLIRDCPVTVYSDGLMSYGPTRDELAVHIGRRVIRLLHLDLLPAVSPLLLREYGVPLEPIPDSAFLKVVAELPEPPADGAIGCPVIVGQYLSQLGILTAQEELDLHAGMLQGLVARGHGHVVFKPHPAAGRAHVHPLEETARRLNVRLTVAGDGPAEAWFAAARPVLVVSCFSTALLTASRYYGIPAATMGAELALERITPYQNSNRIPTTIVDATLPALRPDGTLSGPPGGDVAQLVRAVGFCMQAGRNPDLRDAAASYLREHGPERYFKKRRLERVGLVPPPPYRSATVRRFGRAGRRALARGRTAWAARAWTPRPPHPNGTGMEM
jgi:hypothetical protein